MTAPKPKCPECNRPFATVQLLSMHRRNAHGIVGMSKGAIQEREKRANAKAMLEAQAPAPPATPLPGQALVSFACDHCQQTFGSKNGLAKHQAKAHGILGQSKSAQDRHRLKLKKLAAQAPPPPPPQPPSHVCEQCGFTAKNHAGLLIHIGTRHKKEIALAPSHEEAHLSTPHARNGHAAAHQPHRDGIPEATLALALGRFQGLCTSMAAEFDLPQRSFAARLAELIWHTAVR